MRRTTPPRPIDVTAVLPQLAPLARPAIRLHPRPGSPTPLDSSVGGGPRGGPPPPPPPPPRPGPGGGAVKNPRGGGATPH
ncbi:hypothetical protein ACIRUY_28130, partial [Streptomyces erythrochromogenes]